MILKFDLSNFKLLISNFHDRSWIHRWNTHQFCLKMTSSLSDKTSDNIIYVILKFDKSNFKLLISNHHDKSWIHRLNKHQSLENIATQCFLLTSDNVMYYTKKPHIDSRWCTTYLRRYHNSSKATLWHI